MSAECVFVIQKKRTSFQGWEPHKEEGMLTAATASYTVQIITLLREGGKHQGGDLETGGRASIDKCVLKRTQAGAASRVMRGETQHGRHYHCTQHSQRLNISNNNDQEDGSRGSTEYHM